MHAYTHNNIYVLGRPRLRQQMCFTLSLCVLALSFSLSLSSIHSADSLHSVWLQSFSEIYILFIKVHISFEIDYYFEDRNKGPTMSRDGVEVEKRSHTGTHFLSNQSNP